MYRRPDHVRRTIEALGLNAESIDSDLIVFSDGPKGETAASEVSAVRQYLRSVTGFRSVKIVERRENLGLAQSIIGGVSQVLEDHDRLIVMEDDLVTSPHFLRYMNEALEEYRDDDRVVSVHAYVYPVAEALPPTFFLRGADCWGWGTWRRGWKVFVEDGERLLAELERRNLTKRFDFDGAFDYTRMLREQIAGTNDSWAIRWYASAFLAEKLTLYPGRSLVHNIGNDSSGVHSEATDSYNVKPSETPVPVGGIPVKESADGRRAFVAFGHRERGSTGLGGRIMRVVKRVFH